MIGHVKKFFPKVSGQDPIKWYQVLDVHEGAGKETICAEAKRLRCKVHPDRVNATYRIDKYLPEDEKEKLAAENEERRKAYDIATRMVAAAEEEGLKRLQTPSVSYSSYQAYSPPAPPPPAPTPPAPTPPQQSKPWEYQQQSGSWWYYGPKERQNLDDFLSYEQREILRNSDQILGVWNKFYACKLGILAGILLATKIPKTKDMLDKISARYARFRKKYPTLSTILQGSVITALSAYQIYLLRDVFVLAALDLGCRFHEEEYDGRIKVIWRGTCDRMEPEEVRRLFMPMRKARARCVATVMESVTLALLGWAL